MLISETDKIVENNIGLVHYVAGKFTGRGVDYEDLVGIGSIGLVKAAKKFNKSLNFKFSTYAVPLIIGEIKRYLRDDGIIKVSRKHKENLSKINFFIEEYQKKNDSSPQISEISHALNMNEEDILDALDAKITCDSYDAKDDNNEYLMDKISAEKNVVEDIDNKILVKDILETLDKRSKQVIILRYFKDKTQQQIANEIGISQVQVSRIEKKVIAQLKDKLMC